MSAALLNLERHRGGRQDQIDAYSHFASPVIGGYRKLLAVYPSALGLTTRVRVSHKMQIGTSAAATPAAAAGASSSTSTQPSATATAVKDRWLSDYVNKDKMESVRDSCKATLDDLEGKNRQLTETLAKVAKGTEQLRVEFDQDW